LTISKKVLKNFSFLLGSDLITKALGFVSIIYLSRVLTVQGFGQIEFAQAIIIYFILLVNQGLDVWGVREIAREQERKNEIADNILSIRFFLSLLAYGVLVLFVLAINKPWEIKKLILLYGLTIFTFSFTLNWFFQGIERMEIIAVGQLVNQLLYVGGILFLVKNNSDIFQVPVIKFVAAFFSLTLLAFLFLKINGPLKLSMNPSLWKQIFKQSLPMGFSLIVIQIYYNLDTIMLGFIKGEKEVGWYNAAYKMVLLFIGFAGLFGNAIFPTLSRYHKKSKEKLQTLIRQSSRVTLFFGIPIAMGICCLSQEIIQTIYGSSYLKGTVALQILAWSIFTIYWNAPFAFLLLAAERQKEYMYAVTLGASINLLLNFILIPRYSLLGASIATIICEIVVLSLILFYSRGLIKVPLLAHLIKGFVSSFLMGLILYCLPFNLLIKILIGALSYFIWMYILKGFTRQDVRLAFQLLKSSY
jgi:O-antigen/teichoic acid export membrane protein